MLITKSVARVQSEERLNRRATGVKTTAVVKRAYQTNAKISGALKDSAMIV